MGAMKTGGVLLILALSFFTQSAIGQSTPASTPSTAATTSSAEMQRLFDEDQAARQKPAASKEQAIDINRQDAARRIATQKLIAENELHTAQDFENAAFIFQHGDTADDYLLAHTLAMIAIAKGHTSALWIATATLDRYLGKIGQPQIYGTQYHRKPDTPWTQEPYNRTLISDGLRQQLDVPNLAAQKKQLETYKTQFK
jgi:hypothetical protein